MEPDIAGVLSQFKSIKRHSSQVYIEVVWDSIEEIKGLIKKYNDAKIDFETIRYKYSFSLYLRDIDTSDLDKRYKAVLREICIECDTAIGALESIAPKELEKHKESRELSDQIFVVHGHDEAIKEAVARTLEKLELKPIILHEQPSKGRTIIEKLSDYSDIDFAVVLLSPDDLAYTKDQSPEKAKLRARQNVIFELGFFIGRLGRDRVLALYRGVENFEIPSDYQGVLYTPYDESGAWRLNLVNELKACGYDVDANKLR